MSNLKLCVEVISARLKPREERTHHGDGYGGVNASVEIRFDGQIVKTSTKIDDASPVWNEKFFFNISDTEDLSNLILEAYVYNKTSSITKSCLGKIRIFGPRSCLTLKLWGCITLSRKRNGASSFLPLEVSLL